MEDKAISAKIEPKGDEKTTVYTYRDGRRVRLRGDISYRNHNPGCLRFPNDGSAKAAGALARDEHTGSAVFPDYATGKAVADAWWDRETKDGKSLGQAVRKYLGGKVTEAEIEKRTSHLERKLGVKRDTRLNSLSADKMMLLKEYNRQLEGEKNGLRTGTMEALPSAESPRTPKTDPLKGPYEKAYPRTSRTEREGGLPDEGTVRAARVGGQTYPAPSFNALATHARPQPMNALAMERATARPVNALARGAGIGPGNALADGISRHNRNALAGATDPSSHPETRVSDLYFFERPFFYLPEGAKIPKVPWWELIEDPREAAPKYDVGPKVTPKVTLKVPLKREPWIWPRPEPPHPDFDLDKFRPWPVT